MTAAPPDAFDEALAAATLRKAWADSLAYAIGQCNRRDAAQVMIAALEDMIEDEPLAAQYFELRRDDAEYWAWCADQPNLMMHTFAGLKEMTRRAITLRTRRQLIAELWRGLPPADRRAFIAKASGEAAP